MSVCGKCGKNFDTVTSGSNIYCPDCCKEIEAAGFPIREILEKSAKKPKAAVMCGIKDSGERTTFSTGAQRDMHSGKGRMDLLPWAAIIEVAAYNLGFEFVGCEIEPTYFQLQEQRFAEHTAQVRMW